MAPTQAASTSLNDFIQAGRQKKKNETLAQEMLGRGRKANVSQLGVQANLGKGSLASRITKPGPRSASSTGIRPSFHQTLKRAQSTTQIERSTNQQALLRRALGNESLSTQKGFSIKGRGGPYVVVGSNFAPGTTSADIQAAMEPVGGEMVSCMVISASPTVIAEMVFEGKNGADAVVARFNNQRADGRLLHLYHKNGAPATEPLPSASGLNNSGAISDGTGPQVAQREERAEGEKIKRKAEPEIQDGSYGFAANDAAMDTQMSEEPRPRYEDRPQYPADRRNEYNRNDGRYDGGRGSYYGRGGGDRDGARSYDYRAQRGERGLYSDRFSRGSRDGRYR